MRYELLSSYSWHLMSKSQSVISWYVVPMPPPLSCLYDHFTNHLNIYPIRSLPVASCVQLFIFFFFLFFFFSLLFFPPFFQPEIRRGDALEINGHKHRDMTNAWQNMMEFDCSLMVQFGQNSIIPSYLVILAFKYFLLSQHSYVGILASDWNVQTEIQRI